MNLGLRIAGALAALSGNLSASVAANTTADADFRTQTEATLTALGTVTTDLKARLDGLSSQVEAGEAIDPAVFADIKAKVDSLDEAFPDAEVLPPADDDEEDPIVDEGSTTE
ncbi:MAG: hypothetical protein WKF79_00270 [Nocardioides sp.]